MRNKKKKRKRLDVERVADRRSDVAVSFRSERGSDAHLHLTVYCSMRTGPDGRLDKNGEEVFRLGSFALVLRISYIQVRFDPDRLLVRSKESFG